MGWGENVGPSAKLDNAELCWWREFAAKQAHDSQLPKVGSPLLGHQYRVIVVEP